MKKLLLSFALVHLYFICAQAQAVQQSFQFQHYWDISIGAAPDPYGNVFVAGDLFNSARTSTGFDRLRKLDATGSTIWAVALESNSSGWPIKIASDRWGNCYLLGSFVSSIQFIGGPLLTGNGGLGNLFIAKFDGAGEVVWMQKIEASQDFTGYEIACDSQGDILLSGYNSGSPAPVPSPTLNFGSGITVNARSFVARISSAGIPVWATGVHGNVKGVSVHPSGEIAIAGDLTGQLAIGSDTYPSYTAGMFAAKLSATGEAIWASRIGTSGSLKAVAADPFGNVLATGTYSGQSTVFTVKYSAAGTQDWLKTMAGGYGFDAKALITDSNGNCIVTGDFFESFIVQGNTFTASGPVSNSGFDAYLICLSPSGNFEWGLQAGDQSGYTSDEHATHLAIDNQNNLYFTGLLPYYYGPVVRSMMLGTYQSMEIGSFLYKIKTSSVNGVSAAEQHNLWIYPNPNKGEFMVQLSGVKEAMVNVELRNGLGQVVWQKTLPAVGGEVQEMVRTSGLSTGVYYLQVNGGKGNVVQKVVID